jgi:hypothetical protein
VLGTPSNPDSILADSRYVNAANPWSVVVSGEMCRTYYEAERGWPIDADHPSSVIGGFRTRARALRALVRIARMGHGSGKLYLVHLDGRAEPFHH